MLCVNIATLHKHIHTHDRGSEATQHLVWREYSNVTKWVVTDINSHVTLKSKHISLTKKPTKHFILSNRTLE